MSEPKRRRSSSSSFSWLLARRYLRSERSEALITRLSIMTEVGLCLGVAALILALAMLSGFQSNLLDDELRRSPELQILGSGEGLERLRSEVEQLEGVVSVQRLASGRGWLIDRDEFRPVEIVAYEESVPAWFPELDRRSYQDDGAESVADGVWLSDRRARAWALQPGDRIQLVSPRATLTPMGRPMPMRRQLAVAGTWSEGRDPDFERVAAPLSLAGPLVGDGNARLDVGLKERHMATSLASEIRARAEALGVDGSRFRVETWRDLNVGLLFVLRLEKVLVFLAVFLIVMVASFALISDLALILSSKQSEIGVLSAMGASPRSLRRAFLQLGLLLAVRGEVLGVLLGLVVATVLDRFQLVPLPAGIYIVDHLPFLVRAVDVLVVASACLLLATLCSLWAASRVARLDPIEAIRR